MTKHLRVWLGLAVITIWLAILLIPDTNVHVYFCNVGQGDATLVSWRGAQILVDGGPNDQVLGCLDKYMPFYDRRIELLVLTHPQADHMNGLISVLERYNVMAFVKGDEEVNSQKYLELKQLILQNKVPVYHLTTGDRVVWREEDQQLNYLIVWPTKKYVDEVDPKVDLNRLSRVGILSFGEFEVMLPGDADAPIQPEQLQTGQIIDVEVLKVPHHGSKMGIIPEWLNQIKPELAVISVGKNSFGHPAATVISSLEEAGALVKRTDTDGDVEVVSNGSEWWVE